MKKRSEPKLYTLEAINESDVSVWVHLSPRRNLVFSWPCLQMDDVASIEDWLYTLLPSLIKEAPLLYRQAKQHDGQYVYTLVVRESIGGPDFFCMSYRWRAGDIVIERVYEESVDSFLDRIEESYIRVSRLRLERHKTHYIAFGLLCRKITLGRKSYAISIV